MHTVRIAKKETISSQIAKQHIHILAEKQLIIIKTDAHPAAAVVEMIVCVSVFDVILRIRNVVPNMLPQSKMGKK